MRKRRGPGQKKVSLDRYRKILVSASLGGKARAAQMSPEERLRISLKACRARWDKRRVVKRARETGYPVPASPGGSYDAQLQQLPDNAPKDALMI